MQMLSVMAVLVVVLHVAVTVVVVVVFGFIMITFHYLFFYSVFAQVNESLKGKTSELREELESEQEKAQPVRKEADALRNKVHHYITPS